MTEQKLHPRRNEGKRVRRCLEVLEREKVRRTFSLSLSLSLRRIHGKGDKTLVTKDKKEVNEEVRDTVLQLLLLSLFSIVFIQNRSCFFHFQENIIHGE